MALIKNTQAHGMATHGFEDLGDLKDQAEQALRAAHAEANRIIEQARAQAAADAAEAVPKAAAEGRETGLAEGREAGARQGRADAIKEYTPRLEQLTQSWTAALDDFEVQRNDMLLAAREDILEFALAMGAKVTHRIIENDPGVVADQVVEALSLVADPHGVTLSVNPADRTLVGSMLGDLTEKIGRTVSVELQDDPQVSRGGCVVTTGKGRIDATIELQIERIVDTLLPQAKGKKKS